MARTGNALKAGRAAAFIFDRVQSDGPQQFIFVCTNRQSLEVSAVKSRLEENSQGRAEMLAGPRSSANLADVYKRLFTHMLGGKKLSVLYIREQTDNVLSLMKGLKLK